MSTKKRRVLVERLIERDGVSCTWCCREMIDKRIDPRIDCALHMTLEHLMPLSLGGTHELINLALACFECNNERGSNLEFESPWSV